MHRGLFKCTIGSVPVRGLRANLLISRHWSEGVGTKGKNLLYRDVLVVDHSWSEEEFSASVTDAKGRLYHPSSTHVMGKYAMHEFNHGKFHFNTQGEFVYQVIPAHVFARGSEPAIHDVSDSHSVVVWPDRLFVKKLSSKDISGVLDCCMSSGPALSAMQVKASILKNNPHSIAEVLELDRLVVAVACASASGGAGVKLGKVDVGEELVLKDGVSVAAVKKTNDSAAYRKAHEALNFFRQAVAELEQGSIDSGESAVSPLLMMTAEMRGHRRATSVLLLPPGKAHEDDSFAFLEGAHQAKSVLRRHLVK